MNKKLFVLIFCMVLLVTPLISAADWDNLKVFDDAVGDYGKVTIYNWNFIGQLFDIKLIELELKENTDVCAERCEAIKEIILYNDGSLIDDVKFETIKGDSRVEQQIRDYNFYILDGEKKTEYVLGEEVKAGTYNVLLEGKKKPSRTIDWIIKSQGIWIDDWTIWSAGEETYLVYDAIDFGRVTAWAVNSTNGTYVAGAKGEARYNITNISDREGFPAVGKIMNITFQYKTMSSFNCGFSAFWQYSDDTTDSATGVITGVDEPYHWTNISNPQEDKIVSNFTLRADLGANSDTCHLQNPYFVIFFEGRNVSLGVPVNNTIFNDTNVNFNCSAISSEVAPIVNMSIFTNRTGSWIPSNTSDRTGETNVTSMNVSFENDGEYLWNCQACDSDDDCGFSSENRSITIDRTVPDLTINLPTILEDYAYSGKNETLNWTYSDLHNGSCWFNYDGTDTDVNCVDGNATFTLAIANYNITFFANDSAGNINLTYYDWTYKTTENSQSYSNITTEGNSETFQINLTIPSTRAITTKDLFYNKINQGAGTLTNIIENNYSILKTIEIPNVAADVNITFYWNMSLDDGTIFQSSKANQTVTAFSVDDCTTQGTLVLNYSLKDEETQAVIDTNGNTLNSTVDLDVNVYTFDTSALVINYSYRYTNNTNPQVCIINEALNNTEYSMDVVARYEATNYATEYSHIQSFTLSNNTIPQNINLFDLDSDDSTEFLITFKDESFALVDGALIDITRSYVDEGLFKTIEIPKTDSNGQTMGHFVQNDVIYTIIISKAGSILATFNDVIAICADATIGDCKMNLNAFSTGVPSTDFDTEYNLNFATTFDEDARRITTIFSTQDGSVSTVQLNATQFTGYGNTTVCNHLLTSSSGTLICDIPESFGNVTVIAKLYSSSSPDRLVKIWIFTIKEDAYDIFGYTGIILVFILILTIPFMLISSTIGMVIGTFVGLIIAALLNIYEGGGIIGVGSTIIWAIVAGGIIIWKIAQRGET